MTEENNDADFKNVTLLLRFHYQAEFLQFDSLRRDGVRIFPYFAPQNQRLHEEHAHESGEDRHVPYDRNEPVRRGQQVEKVALMEPFEKIIQAPVQTLDDLPHRVEPDLVPPPVEPLETVHGNRLDSEPMEQPVIPGRDAGALAQNHRHHCR